MITKKVKIDPDDIKSSIKYIRLAADIIKNGGLVAFPTETVYGLGCDAYNSQAVKKIFEVKGRPSDNPLIVHIPEESWLDDIIKSKTACGEKLIKAFWPGPMTLVFEKAEGVIPYETSGGLNTVAVRYPMNSIAREIIKESGCPIAAPSANSSGKPSPTKASHVEFDLDGKIDMIIDGGAATYGLESTVIDVTGDYPIILRPGSVTEEMIEEVCGKVELDSSILQGKEFVGKAISPGQKYKHYSPEAFVTIVMGNDRKKVADKINLNIKKDIESGHKLNELGVICTDETKDLYDKGIIMSLGSLKNPVEIGSNLFRTLRKFDFLEVKQVYSEGFPNNSYYMAVMNRLEKAAGYRIINVN